MHGKLVRTIDDFINCLDDNAIIAFTGILVEHQHNDSETEGILSFLASVRWPYIFVDFKTVRFLPVPFPFFSSLSLFLKLFFSISKLCRRKMKSTNTQRRRLD